MKDIEFKLDKHFLSSEKFSKKYNFTPTTMSLIERDEKNIFNLSKISKKDIRYYILNRENFLRNNDRIRNLLLKKLKINKEFFPAFRLGTDCVEDLWEEIGTPRLKYLIEYFNSFIGPPPSPGAEWSSKEVQDYKKKLLVWETYLYGDTLYNIKTSNREDKEFILNVNQIIDNIIFKHYIGYSFDLFIQEFKVFFCINYLNQLVNFLIKTKIICTKLTFHSSKTIIINSDGIDIKEIELNNPFKIAFV